MRIVVTVLRSFSHLRADEYTRACTPLCMDSHTCVITCACFELMFFLSNTYTHMFGARECREIEIERGEMGERERGGGERVCSCIGVSVYFS